jgi:hypothetical protein
MKRREFITTIQPLTVLPRPRPAIKQGHALAAPSACCPSRKSYPRVAMMQSEQNWCGNNGSRPLDSSP